jgi:hypothetical protein
MLQIVNDFEKKTSWGLFMSDSPPHVAWDLFGFLCIIYQMIVTPYRISFEVAAEGMWYYVEIVIDVYFIIDIIVCFNSSIIDKGIVVAERGKVIVNYLRGWFMIDLMAAIPYVWIIEMIVLRDSDASTEDMSYLKTPTLL